MSAFGWVLRVLSLLSLLLLLLLALAPAWPWPLSLSSSSTSSWRNVAGNVQCNVAAHEYPVSEDAIVAALRRAQAQGHARGRPLVVRVAGSGHSWTPLVCPPEGGAAEVDLMLHLDQDAQLLALEPQRRRVTVAAGMRLSTLLELLASYNLSLAITGTEHVQTAAGAIQTGTHGSSWALSSLSSQVVALRLVLPNGTVLVLDEEDPACASPSSRCLLDAARTALGQLGVVSAVAFRTVPLRLLRKRMFVRPINDVLGDPESFLRQHEHAAISWVPYTDSALLWTLDYVPDGERPGRSILEQISALIDSSSPLGLSAVARIEAFYPPLLPYLHRLMVFVLYLFPLDYTGPPSLLLRAPLPSPIPFDTERFVSWSQCPAAFQAYVEFLKATSSLPDPPFLNGVATMRVVAPERGWLSLAQGDRHCALDLFTVGSVPPESFVASLQEFFAAQLPGSRPHLAKWHWERRDSLQMRWARWEDFESLRQELDPQGVLHNKHLFR